jgi:M6 family metalloprotease-like protein
MSQLRASVIAMALLACTAPRSGSPSVTSPDQGIPAIDPQQVQDQDRMTWSDYRPIPGTDWANAERRGSRRQMRIALVAADFSDQPFVMTLRKGSDLFGNPRVDPVRREEIPRYYADFYNRVLAVNRGHTIHEYWMEQSRGRIGASVTPFGPYRMPHRFFQYGDLAESELPDGYAADNNATRQLDSIWRADQGDTIARPFDLVLRIYAGYDETGTWQEFGEMKFQTKDDIPREWGNPDATKPRWVRTRYAPWTSWMAGVWLWSNSSIMQGESINSIRHEVAHAAFGVSDNYNNPYATPYRRAPAGPWDLMDRGSFNGPGGPHRRFVLPPVEGGSMSAGLMLRQRLMFSFVDTASVLFLNRDGLAETGLAVARVTARAIDPPANTVAGIVVRLDGAAPRDRTPVDDPARNPLSAGTPDYDFYTVEVVQRIGYDSFVPDNGVLIAKNKDRPAPTGGPNGPIVHTWAIDAHPEDITVLDFKRPRGEPVMRSIADYRQLNDALFHAGVGSGSQYEWRDVPNRLHFYVVDVHRDDRGILSYTLAVRSLDGAGPHVRGASLIAPVDPPVVDGTFWRLSFTLVNTGASAPTPTGAHPRDASTFVGADVYRLSASVDGRGWTTHLSNALASLPPGASRQIPILVRPPRTGATDAIVTLTARSESDPSRVATSRFIVVR